MALSIKPPKGMRVPTTEEIIIIDFSSSNNLVTMFVKNTKKTETSAKLLR